KLVKYVILVDDGSTDDTALVAHQEGAIVVSHYRQKGLAKAMYTGLAKALKYDTDIIFTTDADGQYCAEDVPHLISALILENADMVLGSRLKGNIERMASIKKIGNIAFTRALRRMTGIPISDGQTGFRAFKKEAVEEILPLMLPTFTYTQQQLLIAGYLKLKVREIPITFRKREDGSSRLMSGPFSYAYKAWIALLVSYSFLNPRRFFVRIGFGILLVGLIGLSAIIPLSYVHKSIPLNLTIFIWMGLLGIFSGVQTIIIGFVSRR
ncbi:MAG: glycosyltransferase, partial [Candidatus Hodarchaeota archaeon]